LAPWDPGVRRSRADGQADDAQGARRARLLEALRTGESRTLVVRGEPGAGKTALQGPRIPRLLDGITVAALLALGLRLTTERR
jgi:hypothetical protein